MSEIALQPRICECNQLSVIAPRGYTRRQVREAIDGTWMADAIDIFFCDVARDFGFCSKCGKGFVIPCDEVLETAFVFVNHA